MEYVSTRGGGEPQRFSDILLEGLAPDGGLYVPDRWPSLPARRPGSSYAERAAQIVQLFVGDDLPAATVTVLLPEGQRDRRVAFRPGALVLQGRLDYGPAEVEPGRVSWLRLQLTANALESAASPAVSHAH